MEKMKEYMKRIYGMDALSLGCVLLSVAINLVFAVLLITGHGSKAGMWNLISYLPLLVCVFRFFSTNREKRIRENEWFIRRLDSIFLRKADNDYGDGPSYAGYQERQREDRKHFRFFKCPACRQKIRVPRGKGRIEITCPRCGNRFIKKS